MVDDIQVSNYGDYSSDNYGTHSLKFADAFGNEYWFSYHTLVAFRIGGEFHIIKNYWQTTTGKHLNWIDPDENIREDYVEFNHNFERLSKKGEES